MTARNKRAHIAQDTLKVLEQGHYLADTRISIKNPLEQCVQNTQLYTPERLAVLKPSLPNYSDAVIEVVQETSLQGAKRLYDSQQFEHIGVLNFASAKNAGGGFLGGSQAQEESLARSSGLYMSLQQAPAYYTYHRSQSKTLLYSDHMIVSPQCPVIKDDAGEYITPYFVDFITSPAPNYGALQHNEAKSLPHLEAVFLQRMEYVLQVAIQQGCDALILGAWGCGVFRNDPQQVARLFAHWLAPQGKYHHAFKYICFSIPAGKHTENLEAFVAQFT